MKLPRNGSVTANCLFVAAGAVLGALLTWWARSPETALVDDPVEERQQPTAPHGNAPQSGDEEAGSLLQQAHAAQDAGERASLFRKAGAEAGRSDVLRALRTGLGIPAAQERLEFHRGLFGSWADGDPEAALDYARDHFEAGQLRSEIIGIVINKWAEDHPREAWLWAEQNLDGPLKERALTDLMIGWTRRSPEVAADWFRNTGLSSPTLVSAVAGTWAEQAPSAAAAWASDLPDGPAKQTAEIAVASEWASQDPEAAVAHYTDSVSQPEGVNLAVALADVWATTDPAATAEWLTTLAPGASRDHAAAALATIWGASDIHAAISWCQELSDASMRQRVITQLGTTWGAIEPTDALDWLNGLPPAEAFDGVTGAFYSWAGTAPETLQDWLAGSPSPELADRARLSLGDVLTSSDLPAAMDLALGMNSDAARTAAIARFFREWRKTDDPGAQDWLDSHWFVLSSEAQERLQAELSREVPVR